MVNFSIFFINFRVNAGKWPSSKTLLDKTSKKQIIRHFACSALILWNWYVKLLSYKIYSTQKYILLLHNKTALYWMKSHYPMAVFMSNTSSDNLHHFAFLTLKDRCLSDIFYHLYAKYVKWWILICISMET